MKLGILHLSDIHFRTGRTNSILSRSGEIARSISLISQEIELLVVAVTGDIAFAGKVAEYEMARDFFGRIDKELRANKGVKAVEFVFAPGNHDCDFDHRSAPVRSILVKNALQAPSVELEPAVVEQQLAVQENYREFYKAMTGRQWDPALGGLAHSAIFGLGKSNVLFRCCNTAWLSQKSEKQGELLVPVGVVTAPVPRPELVVTLFHHPYSWLRSDNSRDFRQRVESLSDIVLTGHEHEAGQYAVRRDAGGGSDYVEGGVLQGDDPNSSSFNLLLIDLPERKRRLFQIVLRDASYRAIDPDPEWVPLSNKGPSAVPGFAITEEFSVFLNDPGANFTHPHKSKILLDDIFVFPNVREFKPIKARQDMVLQVKSSLELVDVALNRDSVLLFGSEKAGRTALAKALYRQFYARGRVPMYIQGTQIGPTSLKNPSKFVQKILSEQYEMDDLQEFLLLSEDKRVVIFDDFHQVNLNKKGRNEFLDALKQFFGVVVVLGNDSVRIEDVALESDAPSIFLGYRHYEILEFGFLLRSRLIDKWLILGREDVVTESELANQSRRAELLISTVLSRSLIPAYPLFLLVLLQQIETDTPLETTSASYGYFYEVLITRALSVTSRVIDLDTKYTYLSDFAYHMYEVQSRMLAVSEAQSRHEAYCSDYRLNISFVDMMRDLVGSSILQQGGDGYSFKYRYAYYYFVARHLRNNPDKIPAALPRLVKQIHKEEEANVLIFLSYLSREPEIIQAVLNHARSIFADTPLFDFDKDTAFVGNLGGGHVPLSLPDRDPKLNREAFYSEMDKMQHELESDREVAKPENEDAVMDSSSSDDGDELDVVLKLNVAFKTLQILGQILKNSPGSLRGDLKHDIAQECYRLGLRALKAILGVFESNLDSVLADLSELLRGQRQKEDKIPEKAKRLVYMFCEMFALTTLRRISRSVGLDKLERTYDDVLAEAGNHSVAMIDLCIRLDHFDQIPEKKIEKLLRETRGSMFAKDIVRIAVFNRMYMYPLDIRVRQRLCEKLEIDLKKLPARGRSRKD